MGTPPRFTLDTQIDALEAFTGAISKALGQFKKDAGIKSIRQSYKGTGAQRARRQLWITFTDGRVTDLWLGADSYQIGGVLPLKLAGHWLYGVGEDRTPITIASEIAVRLQMLTERTATTTGQTATAVTSEKGV